MRQLHPLVQRSFKRRGHLRCVGCAATGAAPPPPFFRRLRRLRPLCLPRSRPLELTLWLPPPLPLAGRRIGANRSKPSPKHRSGACKANLFSEYRALCAALPLASGVAAVAAPPLQQPPPQQLPPRVYGKAKAKARDYQERKAVLLAAEPFRGWTRASALGVDEFEAEAEGEGGT